MRHLCPLGPGKPPLSRARGHRKPQRLGSALSEAVASAAFSVVRKGKRKGSDALLLRTDEKHAASQQRVRTNQAT